MGKYTLILFQPIRGTINMVKAKLFEVETQQGTLSTTMVNTKMGSK